jgi:dienelactone hydrolase
MCCCTALAQKGSADNADGKIVEKSAYTFPAYEQIPDRFKRAFSRAAIERVIKSPDLELVQIKYMSDGLKIAGFIYQPRKTEGKKLPVVVWNHGHVGEESKIGNENFETLYEMHRLAAEGFVVLASQYRGIGGSEGKDEVAGADTDDVMNLILVAKSLDYVDMDRLFMWGLSRGGLMTLQVIKRGAPVRAAAVVGVPTDYVARMSQPFSVEFFKTVWPDFDKRRDEHARSRSPILWADQINVPLLIFQGGGDRGVTPTETMAFAQKLEQYGSLYELIIYAKDDHEVSQNTEDRLRRTVDWFKNVRTLSLVQVLGRTLRERGAEAAVKQYYDLKKNQADRYDFGEPELNTLGYLLLREGRTKDAIEIFKLNVAVFPEGFNTYDSLGEAYMANGDRELAIKNYQKSLALNPQNVNAVNMMKRLNAQ